MILKFKYYLLLIVLFVQAVPVFSQNVWIDTDIQFTKFGRDVDDGLALIIALKEERISIKGISLIHKVEHANRVTKKLAAYYAEYNIPIYKGVDDASKGTVEKNEAVIALAAALKKEPLTILALGPATNIASLLTYFPEVQPQIKEIVFCAGRQAGATFKPKGSKRVLLDYNYELDSGSFKKILDTNIPVTLAGYEAADSLYFYKEDIKAIKHNGRAGDKWVARQLSNWLFSWKIALGVKGFIPFDVATIGSFLYPEYFKSKQQQQITVNYRENDSYFLVKADHKTYLETSEQSKYPLKVTFVTEVEPAFKQKAMQVLLKK